MEEKQNRKLAVDFCNILMEMKNTFHNHILPSSTMRLHSHAFHTLCILNYFQQQHITMSELAEKLDITKQQLSKIINDLEQKQFVERIHDTKNRRRVYIQITQAGQTLLEQAGENIIQHILKTIHSITEQDKKRLAEAISTLKEIFLQK